MCMYVAWSMIYCSGSQTFPSRGPFLDLAKIGGPPPCIKIKRHVIKHILLFNYYTMYILDYMLAPRYSELGPACIHVVHLCVGYCSLPSHAGPKIQ